MRRAASRYVADRAALRGGEQQMLAIGRALISRRKLILEFSGASTMRRPTRMPLMPEPDPRSREGDDPDVPIEQHPRKNRSGSKRGR